MLDCGNGPSPKNATIGPVRIKCQHKGQISRQIVAELYQQILDANSSKMSLQRTAVVAGKDQTQGANGDD